ncbi:unnamed protein product [Gongylonema pulchrum]|uniref:COesterase domain-containing protein n=1 Tax=Gongylonema pulchrum TaxID=637853 RepID=A0A183D7C9_9BILA|nr:unnamed protein product [Gongylonema pulchrum]
MKEENDFLFSLISHYYGLNRFEEVSVEECNRNIRKIIDEHYHSSCAQRLHNSTLELISNATFLRYLDSPEGNRSLLRVIFGLQDLEADIEFVAPAQREIDSYVANGLPVYAYSFDYFPKSPIYEEERKMFTIFGQESVKVVRKELQIPREGRSRAFHGLDHAYIFTDGYSSNLQVEPFTKRDRHMAKMLAAMITNFVKNGLVVKLFCW